MPCEVVGRLVKTLAQHIRGVATTVTVMAWDHAILSLPPGTGNRCACKSGAVAHNRAQRRLEECAMDARASRYHDVYARWQRDPSAFWGEAAREIDWYEAPKTVFDPNAGVYGRWFTDGVVNTCWNAVDRHVQRGRAAQPALVYDSPLAGSKRVI